MRSSVGVLLAVCVLASVVAAASLAEQQDQFVKFMKKYDKQYANTEMFARFNVFRSNLALIEAHNADYAAGRSSFKMAVNPLADLSLEEYRATRLGLSHTNAHDGEGVAMPEITAKTLAATPDSWDWRNKGAVNAITDQGSCGSCWAFSATASLEATDYLQTQKLKKLSEQLCVDCVNDGACTCDLGGEMHDCFVEVKALGGDELRSDYPYTSYDGESTGVCHFNKSLATGSFGDYVNVTQYDETALKVAASQMVISIGIDASKAEFQFYDGGVYDVDGCKTAWADLDHGVAIVGYGNDADSGKDYWLVRNSWGGDWGLKGYIWMVRNKNNQCGVATDASYVPPKTASAHAPRRHRSLH